MSTVHWPRWDSGERRNGDITFIGACNQTIIFTKEKCDWSDSVEIKFADQVRTFNESSITCQNCLKELIRIKANAIKLDKTSIEIAENQLTILKNQLNEVYNSVRQRAKENREKDNE